MPVLVEDPDSVQTPKRLQEHLRLPLLSFLVGSIGSSCTSSLNLLFSSRNWNVARRSDGPLAFYVIPGHRCRVGLVSATRPRGSTLQAATGEFGRAYRYPSEQCEVVDLEGGLRGRVFSCVQRLLGLCLGTRVRKRAPTGRECCRSMF